MTGASTSVLTEARKLHAWTWPQLWLVTTPTPDGCLLRLSPVHSLSFPAADIDHICPSCPSARLLPLFCSARTSLGCSAALRRTCRRYGLQRTCSVRFPEIGHLLTMMCACAMQCRYRYATVVLAGCDSVPFIPEALFSVPTSCSRLINHRVGLRSELETQWPHHVQQSRWRALSPHDRYIVGVDRYQHLFG